MNGGDSNTADEPAAGSAPAPPPRVRVRVRVTAPRNRGTVVGAGFPVARELAEQSEVGEVFVRSLIRSQLRLALVVAGGFLIILLGIGLLPAAVPELAGYSVYGVPLPWLMLGAGIYPVVLACAVLYNRSAARNEARYTRLIGR